MVECVWNTTSYLSLCCYGRGELLQMVGQEGGMGLKDQSSTGIGRIQIQLIQ